MGDVLRDLRREHHRLTERAAALRQEVEKAERVGLRLLEEMDARKRALTDGTGTVAEVAAADTRLDSHRRALELAREGLQAVESAVAVAASAVASEERRVESERQEAAARPLREQAEAEVEAFIKAVLTLRAPLERHAALAARIAADLPLAEPLSPLTVGALAARVAAGWDGPVELVWNDPRIRDEEHGRRFAAWLGVVLCGPLSGTTSQALEHLGVAAR